MRISSKNCSCKSNYKYHLPTNCLYRVFLKHFFLLYNQMYPVPLLRTPLPPPMKTKTSTVSCSIIAASRQLPAIQK